MLASRVWGTELSASRQALAEMSACVAQLCTHMDSQLARFSLHKSEAYREIHARVADTLRDWPLNSHALNVSRLLAALQSVFPQLKVLRTALVRFYTSLIASPGPRHPSRFTTRAHSLASGPTARPRPPARANDPPDPPRKVDRNLFVRRRPARSDR